MKCSNCGNKRKKGLVQARDAASITQASTIVTWYPEGDKGRMFKKNGIRLAINGEDYYCDQCTRVYAIFEEK
ncbi:MAG: hypothetical protein Q4E50_03570 [Tissierellia bacterium]|nr:hypothetical protein [Tissierellia bacterium]